MIKFLHEPVSGRTCGECQACCTVLAVPEVSKPLWQPCQHVCATGCSIYDKRPKPCESYECLWRSGHFGSDEHRPDKLGVVLEVQPDTKLGSMIAAREAAPGGFKNQKAKYILEQIARGLIVYMFHHGATKRTIMGPPHKLALITKIVERNT